MAIVAAVIDACRLPRVSMYFGASISSFIPFISTIMVFSFDTVFTPSARSVRSTSKVLRVSSMFASSAASRLSVLISSVAGGISWSP